MILDKENKCHIFEINPRISTTFSMPLMHNNFSLEGNGEFLIQKNFDKAYYKIEKKGDEYLFDTKSLLFRLE